MSSNNSIHPLSQTTPIEVRAWSNSLNRCARQAASGMESFGIRPVWVLRIIVPFVILTSRETMANLISSHLLDNEKKLTFVPVSSIARSVHCLLGLSTADPLGTTEGKVKELKFAL